MRALFQCVIDRAPNMKLFLYLIFALSGAAGLIYESIWARYLGLFVGHSAYARIIVLTIFLGGMALGALAVSRATTRIKDPLRMYALAEFFLAIGALFFHDVFQWVTAFSYDNLFPPVAGGPTLNIIKWAVAGSLILPQAILLGTTFPLMAAGVLRRFTDRQGRTLSLLYFTNSLGAAAGVLLAGFYLVGASGLPGTLLFASILNLFVAGAAVVIAARYPALKQTEAPRPGSGSGNAKRDYEKVGNLLPILLAVSFGTALASFVYEISWLRMLSLVLGSTTRSFDLMLSAFILGLALGSFWVRERSDRWSNPLKALGIVQCLMGLTALLTLPVYVSSFAWMGELITTFAKTDNGYAGFTVARYVISVIVMVPSTFCAGITLPLITRTLLAANEGERAIGAVYGINTLGSIFGVIIAGLIALPLLGLKNLLIAGTIVDIGLGLWILYLVADGPRGARFAHGNAILAVAVIGLVALTTTFDPLLLGSGVYRHGRSFNPEFVQAIFHEDGRTATVTVHQDAAMVTIKTNGKADASLTPTWIAGCSDSTTRRPMSGDATTQTLLGVIPMAHVPGARRAAVVGHGSGLTSHTLLSNPTFESVTTIEIEPQILEGSRVFYPANARVFDDPRSEIVIQDARTHFSARNDKYDIIISEPSNPWVSGVASLFTTEFYEHVGRYMAPGAVFGQWLQLYEMDDGLVMSVMSALHGNFEDYRVYLLDDVDLLIVATNSARLSTPVWESALTDDLAADLCHTIPLTPETLHGAFLTDRRALAPLLDDWEEQNSEFYPTVDLRAERARYLGLGATGLVELGLDRFDFTAPFFQRRVLPAVELSGALATNSVVSSRTRGALMRAFRNGDDPELTFGGYGAPDAINRWEQWNQAINSSTPPTDWKNWVNLWLAVENDFFTGTKGIGNADIFPDVLDYMNRMEAPETAVAAIRFRSALSGWDFAEAASIVDTLAVLGSTGDDWVPVREVFSGGVAAKLLVGDVAGARELWSRLMPRFLNDGFDVNVALVSAYLEAFETEN